MVKAKQKYVHVEDWLEAVKSNPQIKDTALLAKACALNQQLAQGLTTFYGQPYLEQGLEVADILLSLKLDQETAAAGILCGVMALPHPTEDQLKAELGDTVTQLIMGMLKIDSISALNSKMLLAMAKDIRIVIIKLAERVCLLHNIKAIPAEQKKRIALEILEIYAPLANRLGIGQLKWELEDLALRYIDPEAYANIASFLAERRQERERRIQETQSLLIEKLHDANIHANISGRAKHIYSIYAKAKRNHINYKDIYDFSGVRILVNTIEECYSALSIVHSLWSPITKEFDDYIAKPKRNGYQSIHTAVTFNYAHSK